MAVQISGNDITVPRDTTVTRNLTVGGVLTYEDVTNVDSIGIVTARAGVLVGSGITLSKDGDIFATGVTTATTFSGAFSGTTGTFSSNVDVAGELTVAETIAHTGDTNNKISFPSADTITATTAGSERIRIASDGAFGIGHNSPGQLLSLKNTSSQCQQSLTAATDGSCAIYFGDTDSVNRSVIYHHNTGDYLAFYTAASERLRINSSGQLIQRYSADPYNNRAATFQSPAGVSATYLAVVNTESNGQCGILFGDHAGQNAGNFDGYINYDHANQSMQFLVNGGNERMRIDNAGRLQHGHTSSIVGGKIEVHAATAETQITINESSDSGTGPALYINRTRGSNLSSPSPVEDNNYIGSIHFGSYDTNSYEKGASIEARADGQTWADGDCPARLQFLTTPDGSTTPTERLRIHAAGNIACGDTNDLSESSEYALVVHPNRSDATKDALGLYIKGIHGQGGGTTEHSISLRVDNTNTYNNATHMYGVKVTTGQQLLQPGTGVDSNVTGLYSSHKCFNAELNKNLGAVTEGFSYFSNVVPTNSGGAVYHFFGQDNGTTKVYIEQDGDIKNANNSYGSSSDVKLKENIVDAGSQWDDIKGLRIRNFNFKSDPDKVKMLGVVAQEAEPISPGLIDTQNDIETDATTGMGTITGTTKYVKYSILYMKAVKALQEAQTRIETLETKVAALEGG